jgi:hypothetical protein
MEKFPPLCQDAAIVLGLAATAMPFAGSPEAEAERWLRVIRLHGQVGAALQGLGVSEAPIETIADPSAIEERSEERDDVVERVAHEAGRYASRRGAAAVGTIDLLFALLSVYGHTFDRALQIRGTSRDELIGRLYGAVPAARLD